MTPLCDNGEGLRSTPPGSLFPLSFRLYSQRGAEVEWKAYVSGNQLVIGLRWWLVTVTWRAVLDG